MTTAKPKKTAPASLPKKDQAKKPAGKKSPARAPTSKAGTKSKAEIKPPQEVDSKKLGADEAKKRVAAIYRLERIIEGKRRIYDAAKSKAKIAKNDLAKAEAALEQEIREQRFGPGPLFAPDGKGPAKR